MKIKEKFKTNLGPELIGFLFIVPFMCICPLVFTSLSYGFPGAFIENNKTVELYEKLFSQLEKPEQVKSVSKIHTELLGGFDKNSACSLFSGQIIYTNIFRKVSKLYLSNFQKYVASYLGAPGYLKEYTMLSAADLKIIPVNLDEKFSNSDITLDLEKVFKDINLPVSLDSALQTGEVVAVVPEANDAIKPPRKNEKASYYLVYMISRDVIENNDYRCVRKY